MTSKLRRVGWKELFGCAFIENAIAEELYQQPLNPE